MNKLTLLARFDFYRNLPVGIQTKIAEASTYAKLFPGTVAFFEIDSFQADRGPTGAIGSTLVTPQLSGLWARSKRGFFHDGRFPTLLDVADHYNACFNLGLSSFEKSDLVEFLKSR